MRLLRGLLLPWLLATAASANIIQRHELAARQATPEAASEITHTFTPTSLGQSSPAASSPSSVSVPSTAAASVKPSSLESDDASAPPSSFSGSASADLAAQFSLSIAKTADGGEAASSRPSASTTTTITVTGEAVPCYNKPASTSPQASGSSTVSIGISIVTTTVVPHYFGPYDKNQFDENAAAANGNNATTWSPEIHTTKNVSVTYTAIELPDRTILAAPAPATSSAGMSKETA